MKRKLEQQPALSPGRAMGSSSGYRGAAATRRQQRVPTAELLLLLTSPISPRAPSSAAATGMCDPCRQTLLMALQGGK